MAYATIPLGKLKRVDRIAQGNFGTVYKAIWNRGLFKDRQTVAAKQVSREEGEHEVEFLSKLDHPNIVKLLGVADKNVDFYIVLELCEGGSLWKYLNAHRGTHLGQQFYDWAKQAGKPVAYLKTMGVTHKDIKSPNYLITNDNILKLCDFGLAKDVEVTMSKATESASYPWMAPELLRYNKLSPSYDIYAFGVVVWELWTTDPPFEDAHVPTNLVWRICEKNERPPIPAECPKPIADLLRQCWEVDWTKRPSMDDVMSMLESAEHEASKKVILTGPWEFERQFGYQHGPGKLRGARDVVVCPNGDVAVSSHLSGKVLVYNNNAEYKFPLDPTLDPALDECPEDACSWNVAINADGIFYMTCARCVQMFTAQGKFKCKWVAVSPDNKHSDIKDRPTELRGLTIDNHDNNGHLLVGQVQSPMYISKHRQDGYHIASIKVSIAPYYLAVTSKGRVVISNAFPGSIVQIIDSTGHVFHTLDSHNKEVPFWQPRGVCCYNDIILVCNSDKCSPNEISCFSVSAEYLGSIPVRKAPHDVTILKGGRKLFVACHDRVLVYKNQALFL